MKSLNAKGLLIIVIILLAVAAAVYYFLNQKNESTNQSDIREIPTTYEVSLTDSGFEPSELKTKVGEIVIWTNNTNEDATVNSDDHPTHKLFPILNNGIFTPGTSVQVRFEQPGSYNYHDHLHPERTGTITVE